MKYLITEEQDKRIMEIIKSVGDTYSNECVAKTDVEVESHQDSSGQIYYMLYPIFYMTKDKHGDEIGNCNPALRRIFRHMLADFVEAMVGVPIHTSPARIKVIE